MLNSSSNINEALTTYDDFENKCNEKAREMLSNEETFRSATLQFVSFIHHSIEDIELIKSLNGFARRALRSNVMTVLLNFPVIRRYLPKKSN